MKFKIFIVLITFLFLGSCGDYKVYRSDGSNKISAGIFIDPVVPNFIICSGVFAKRSNINYEASLRCATIHKRAELKRVSIFNTCYLFNPVTSIYACV